MSYVSMFVTVVFTLQIKGSYNLCSYQNSGKAVVFTLQTKGSYNLHYANL